MLTACGSAVSIPVPSPVSEVASVCQELSAVLPDEVMGQLSRETDPQSELTAAWGSPAIVLRCGVAEPAAFKPTSEVAVVEGVDWYPQQLAESYLFTTSGRIVHVEVNVPGAYQPGINPLVDLADAVKQAIPKA